jgi:hypothetical protein
MNGLPGRAKCGLRVGDHLKWAMWSMQQRVTGELEWPDCLLITLTLTTFGDEFGAVGRAAARGVHASRCRAAWPGDGGRERPVREHSVTGRSRDLAANRMSAMDTCHVSFPRCGRGPFLVRLAASWGISRPIASARARALAALAAEQTRCLSETVA